MRVGLIVMLIVGLLLPTSAQDAPTWELTVSVSEATARGEYEWLWYPGWAIEGTKYLDDTFAVVGAVTGNRRSKTFSNGWGESHNLYGFLSGMRVAGPRQRRAVPFGEILGGAVLFDTTLRTEGKHRYFETRFAIQPGGGIDFAVSPALGVRAFATARIVEPWHSFAWHFPLWRFGGGVIYRFGQ